MSLRGSFAKNRPLKEIEKKISNLIFFIINSDSQNGRFLEKLRECNRLSNLIRE
jgi:hypothetical protein